MTLDVKQSDNGILIGDRFVYAPQKVIPGIINLQLVVGEEMAYDRGSLLSLDFPGEYDIDGTLISVFVGNTNRLNYFVSYKDKAEKFGIIQSPEVLERSELPDMDAWLYSDEAVAKKLDQLEVEGERIDLNAIPFGLMES